MTTVDGTEKATNHVFKWTNVLNIANKYSAMDQLIPVISWQAVIDNISSPCLYP